jgi:DNA repair protein RecO (recombination protein O)
LKLVDFGEADRVVTLLAATDAPVFAMAKSARRSQRRFGGALDLFCHVIATVRERRGADLKLLEQVDLVEGFLPLRADPARLAHASVVVETARELTREGNAAPGLFEHTRRALHLAAFEPLAPHHLVAYVLRALGAAGFAPELARCAECGGSAAAGAAPVRFDVARGGVMCRACPPGAGPGVHLKVDTLTALRAYQAATLVTPPEPSLSRDAAARCLDLVGRFMAWHTGRRLRSPEMLGALGG